MEKKPDKNGDDFWRNHSLKYLEMAFRTDKREVIEKPDAYGKRTGVCGDTIEMFLTVNNDRIESLSFNTNGCLNTNACANAVVCMAEGKNIDQAWGITAEDVVDFLETLPVEAKHCAELAVGALYLTLSNYQMIKRDPWKKLYKKN